MLDERNTTMHCRTAF